MTKLEMGDNTHCGLIIRYLLLHSNCSSTKILVNLPFHKKYYGTGDTLTKYPGKVICVGHVQLKEKGLHFARKTRGNSEKMKIKISSDPEFVDCHNIHFFSSAFLISSLKASCFMVCFNYNPTFILSMPKLQATIIQCVIIKA